MPAIYPRSRRLVWQKRLVAASRALKPRVGLVDGVKENGLWSPEWKETILRYQARRHLATNGKLDKPTRADILAVIKQAQRPVEAVRDRPPTFGIDVSNNNGYVDWKAVGDARVSIPGHLVNQPVKFAWAKVSEGRTFVDSYWPQNRRDAAANGVLIGGYHFYRQGDWLAQTDHFLEHLGQHNGMLVPAVDWEYDGCEHDRGALEQVIKKIKAETGAWPIVYGNYYNLGGGSWPTGAVTNLHRCPLWLAGYGSNDGNVHDVIGVPKPWKAIAVHQYSSNGHNVSRVKGVSSSFLDVNLAHVPLSSLVDKE